MNRRFTKEELEMLKPAEIHFYTAVKGDFKRATSSKMDTMVADIYDATTENKLHRNSSCGMCSFKMYKTIGEKYYADLEYYNNLVEEESEPYQETLGLENNKATDKEENAIRSEVSGGEKKARKTKGVEAKRRVGKVHR